MPAIRYWNPDVVVNVVKIDDAPLKAAPAADNADAADATDDASVAKNDAPSSNAVASGPKEATLVVRLVDGRERTVSATGLSNQQISDSLKAFMSNPNPIQSLFPSAARVSSN